MFPGYIFVGVLGERDIAPIRSPQGCRQAVRFGGKLAPLPDSMMKQLQGLPQCPQRKTPHTFNEGQWVRMEAGPFPGLEAVYDQPKSEGRVSQSVLGRVRPVPFWADLINASLALRVSLASATLAVRFHRLNDRLRGTQGLARLSEALAGLVK